MFNLSDFFKGMDLIYESGKIGYMEEYLKQGLEASAALGDDGAVFAILNEMIGYYRVSSRHKECEACIEEALKLADTMGISGTLNYGTLLVNAATGYRAAFKYPEAEKLYKEAYEIFKRTLPESDYRMASLHNNLSLLYGETGRLKEAKGELQLAMMIITQVVGAKSELAITHANLGGICFQLKQIQEGTEHMKEAIRIFEDLPGKKDAHYASALAGLGEAYFHEGNLEESVGNYEKALQEIEGTYGRNDSYRITSGNLEKVRDLLRRKQMFQGQHKKGLELSKEYFDTYGKSLIRDKYPEYEGRIAAGLVGEGSECLGFDDFYSTDHDYGPGFCLWLLPDDYHAIGAELMEDYKKLPKEFMGFPARIATVYGQGRVGVFEIGAFYQQLTGCTDVPKTENQWMAIPQEALRTATNGEVFMDGLGAFTKLREGFLKYPERVRFNKLALALGKTAQAGQYNYGRARKRGDKAAMYFALSEFIDGAIEVSYLLNRIYMPFYKWRMRGMEAFTQLVEIKPKLEEMMGLVITDESLEERIETVCISIVEELNRQGISGSRESFLEFQKAELLKQISTRNFDKSDEEEILAKNDKIEQILNLEWEQFQKVQSEGGRSLCQDDYGTFEIMRKSQFLVWDLEVLESYLEDLKGAKENHWNLVMEKYARMMESTAPEQYAGFVDVLPERSAERRKLQEEIITQETRWAELFMERYPKVGARGRKIHTFEDTPWDTSMETYLRGELGTYSDQTLNRYHKMICRLKNEGKNLKEMNLVHMMDSYGYKSLELAEKACG